MKSPTSFTSQSSIFQIASVKFRHQLIKVFSNSMDSQPRLFYFEPLVLLNPKSIIKKSHGSFQRDYIQITIQMWNEKVRSKVLERLRCLESLQNVKFGEDDICVMPFEDVQLVGTSGSLPHFISLNDKPTSYLRSNQNLDFFLFCNEPSSANTLAHDFRQNLEFTLAEWQLKLECRGLAIESGIAHAGSTSLKRPVLTFDISISPNKITSKLL